MTIQEMAKKIAEIESKHDVFVYFKYDCYIQCYVFMMQTAKHTLTRNVPVTEIVTWTTDILTDYLDEMAHDLEIGVKA